MVTNDQQMEAIDEELEATKRELARVRVVVARLEQFTEGDVAQEMASYAWWSGFRAGALFAFAIGLIIAIVLASSGCYMAHEPAQPIAYDSSVEVQLYDHCDASADAQWWIGGAFDGETMMLGDEVLADPMGCAFDAGEPGTCVFWEAGSASWETSTIEQGEDGALRIEIDGRIGPQPDARGHCMRFEYRLEGGT